MFRELGIPGPIDFVGSMCTLHFKETLSASILEHVLGKKKKPNRISIQD
jgi:hypothetical protein